MLILTPETEALIQSAVAQTGKKPDQVVRDALTPGNIFRKGNTASSVPMSEEELIARMEEITVRSSNRSTIDTRSVNDIIGYPHFFNAKPIRTETK